MSMDKVMAHIYAMILPAMAAADLLDTPENRREFLERLLSTLLSAEDFSLEMILNIVAIEQEIKELTVKCLANTN